MASILAVGITTLDIINTVSSYPAEDDEIRALSQQQVRGGNASNTLTILSQLGHQCSWAGTLIDDADNQVIKQDLQQHHIDISACHVLTQGKIPTSYITVNQQTGSRTIVHHRDCPEFSFASFKKIDLSHFDWLHFEGRNITDTVLMLAYCKHYYPTLSCSIEIEKDRPNIEQLFEFADILLFSKKYATCQGFNDASHFLTSLKLNCLMSCTWGEQGAWILSKSNELFHQAALPAQQIIDTLGAGDTFNAGLIHALINDFSIEYALNFACQLAGAKCGQSGLTNLMTHFKPTDP